MGFAGATVAISSIHVKQIGDLLHTQMSAFPFIIYVNARRCSWLSSVCRALSQLRSI